MRTKTDAVIALAVALSAMGLLMMCVLHGAWWLALFAAATMLMAAAQLVHFIAIVQLPQAVRRRMWG